MIKVDEVFPYDIRASIGPAGTMKRLFVNRGFFKSRGYEMTIFANHSTGSHIPFCRFELREMKELPRQSSYSLVAGAGKKKRIVSKIKQVIYNSYLFSYFYVKYKEQKANELLMKSYIARNRRPDIVVLHGFSDCYYYLKYRNRDDNAKVVVFLHSDGRDISMEYKTYPKLKGTRLFDKLYKMYLYVIDHSDRIVYISKLAKSAFLKLHPDFDISKVYIAVNGIDDREITVSNTTPRNKYRLCTAGSVCERKGQYIIIEAMHRMNPEILKDIHLTIIGTGPDFDKLVEKTKEYGLVEHVTFMGNVPNPQVHELLCSNNIFCLMSNNEGLPISIIEAMRAGLPVISTRVAGIPEQVDERNGFLLNPSIEELTVQLNELPNYDWEKLGDNSRKRFEEEFTFERMLKDYVNVFDGLY